MARRRQVDWSQPVNPDAPLNRGLVSWWLAGKGPYWGGPKFLDLCGKNHGTLTNGPTWRGALGRPGGHGSLLFDGSDDYVTVPVAAETPLPTTLLASFHKLSGGSAAPVVFTHNTATSNNGYRMQIFGGNLALTFGGIALYDSGLAVSNGTWYRAAITISGASGTANFYLASGATISTSSTGVGTPSGAPDSYRIGDLIGADLFNGYIDNVKHYSRALSATEVAAEIQASLTGYQQELNYYRRQYIFDVGAGGGGGVAVPALDQGMLTGGLSTLCGGLA